MEGSISLTNLGLKLKEVRQNLRLSQQAVERMSVELEKEGYGYISHSHISEIESGKVKNITLIDFMTLVKIYKIDPEELGVFIGGSNIIESGIEINYNAGRVIVISPDIPYEEYLRIKDYVRYVEAGLIADSNIKNAMEEVKNIQIKEASNG